MFRLCPLPAAYYHCIRYFIYPACLKPLYDLPIGLLSPGTSQRSYEYVPLYIHYHGHLTTEIRPTVIYIFASTVQKISKTV